MKFNVLRFPLALILIFLGTTLLGQKNVTKEADAMFKSLRYFEAISMYKASYTKEKTATGKKLILYKIGYSYYKIEDFDNAKGWLSKSIKAGYKDPEAQYYYAKTLRRIGLYDEAIVEFKKYQELMPSDLRSEQYIKECENAQDWMDNPTRYMVEKDPVLNSKAADFSPVWADKKHVSLIFTSTREGSAGDNVDPITGQSYSSIWSTTQDKKSKKWMQPNMIDQGEGVINGGSANEGSATMDSRFKTVYFTRCSTKKKSRVGCAIYMTKKIGSSWSEVELFPIKLNDTSVAGHPSIGLKDQYLFFASDMPGGFGGKDIWFVKYTKKSKTWSDPINLGSEVNTSGDEMYPFIHDDGRLFFASNGHPGMGSLDIFSSERVGTNDEWNNVENMKSPINSSYNDFAILFDGDKNRGYLTSDRPGGRGNDDIWSFRIPPLKFILAGTISDVDDGSPIPDVNIKLIGTDGTTVEAKSDELGYYEFDQVTGSSERYIKDETSYTMEFSKKSYLNGSGQETTLGRMESTKIVHDVLMQSFKKPIRFPEVRYDLGQWDLQVNDQVNSKDSLDFLYITLMENPTLVIELMAHTDARGKDGKNMTLSQKRAQSCVDYLASKGIPAQRMEAKGYGETQPIIDEATIASLPTKEEKEAAHQKNRRTEFRVLRDDYVPVTPVEEEAPVEGANSDN
ncbi:MAG: peptidoglycan-associated lipoprotein [Salibacteraceae bacterium]|jgi:peptidoglycan-associated lipoprotein